MERKIKMILLKIAETVKQNSCHGTNKTWI